MRFSDLYGISRGKKDDWFDPVLSVDTPLFLDPFLLYVSETGPFAGSHDEVLSFFNEVFKLVADAGGEMSSLKYKKAVANLRFPEVAELCLGYTASGTRGAGSGKEIAALIAELILEAVKAGLTEIGHFEEIGILGHGVGADRISDISAGLLRHRLVKYTEAVCQRHGVPTESVHYMAGRYQPKTSTWVPVSAQLPRNPYNNQPILLVPRRYLRDLPTMNPDGFWEYCYYNENETLRTEFSFDVATRVDKATIVELARKHPHLLQSYADALDGSTAPYDHERDPKGLLRWYEGSKEFCSGHPISAHIQSASDFQDVTDLMVNQFRHFVEQNGGWKLLWNDGGSSKSEDAAQRLFLGIIKHYCQANDIDVSPEPNIGRGPVDFKVSSGYRRRALMELKLARNTKFWSGLHEQLPAYLKAEGIDFGYFVVVCFSEKDLARLDVIQEALQSVQATTGYTIRIVIVDARPPRSASKL